MGEYVCEWCEYMCMCVSGGECVGRRVSMCVCVCVGRWVGWLIDE